MRGIVKRYPGVVALNNVSFDLFRGEVHALVGENGAGKSTLMKILSGAIQPDAGEVLLDGERVAVHSPSNAQHLGISTMYQEARLVPDLNVAENILLGNEPGLRVPFFIDRKALHERARHVLAQLGEEFDTRELVRNVGIAKRQIVEMARALSRKARILVMDEPTASLTRNEIDNLFVIIRRLRSDGISVIYISHRLEEIFEIGDRVSILRDGANVATRSVAGVTSSQLIRWMVGRELDEEYPFVRLTPGEEILRVENISTNVLNRVSFTLRRGEILGLAGLVGAGRTELARILFGAAQSTEGTMYLSGNRYTPHSPAEAIQQGVALLTEDRNNEGLLLEMNVRENISLARLDGFARHSFIMKRQELRAVSPLLTRLRIKTPSTETGVHTLSGGNRQKVILARWLLTNSRLVVFDEPTVGIDVGAKYEIYQRINELAESGVGIIVISSDLPELLGLATRIAILCRGRITGFLDKKEATQEKILTLATQFESQNR